MFHIDVSKFTFPFFRSTKGAFKNGSEGKTCLYSFITVRIHVFV